MENILPTFVDKISIKGETLSQNLKKIISPISSALLSDHVYLEDYGTQDLFAK